MIGHNDVRRGAVEIVAIDVEASVDLRDVSAVKAVGIDSEDALAPRQRIAEGGGTPRS